MHTLVIQPISVVTEILHYRPPITDVSNLKWEIILKERRDKDTKIATITRIVTTVATIVNTVEQQQVIVQGLVNPRTTLKEKLEAKEKRTFYKSRRSDKTICEYVAVAQVQIEAVNNVERTKRKVFKPIEEHSTRGCCHTIPRIITEINNKKNKKPQSWCNTECNTEFDYCTSCNTLPMQQVFNKYHQRCSRTYTHITCS